MTDDKNNQAADNGRHKAGDNGRHENNENDETVKEVTGGGAA
jgi:hypothetical protein